MRALVGALDCEHPNDASPQVAVGGSNAGVPRVALFIYPEDPSGNPTPWEWSDGGIVYDSPAAYRVLGFVSIHS